MKGEDALSFLHNQLTHDFLNLPIDQARFCAFLNAKGRIQASMIGFKGEQDEVLLVLPLELLAQTLKRMSMFILRAKVKITDATSHFVITGHIGAVSDFNHLVQPPHLNLPWQHACTDSAFATSHWVSLFPAQGLARFMCITKPTLEQGQNSSSPSENTSKLKFKDWELSEILSGVCMIGAKTFESFVPQMINYESINGIHFQKGCYPGQEVVARSQFRGTIKRRGFIVSSDEDLTQGEELFENTPEKSLCGQVIKSARPPGSPRCYAFASLALSIFEGAESAEPIQDHPERLINEIEHYPLIQTSSSNIVYAHPVPYALRDDI